MQATSFLLSLFLLVTFIPGIIASKPRLKDATFRCCVIHAEPFIYNASSPPFDYEGINIEFFRKLMDYTGFQCRSEQGENRLIPYGSSTNVTWAAYLNMTANCALPNGTMSRNSSCPCDISAGTWFETPERMKMVTFGPPIMTSDFRIVTNVKNTKSTTSPWLFVDGLQPLIWVFLCLLIGCFALIKGIDPYFDPVVPKKEPDDAATYDTIQDAVLIDVEDRTIEERSSSKRLTRREFQQVLLKTNGLHQARKAVCSTLVAVIGRPADEENRTFRRWLLNYTICLLGLVLMLVYEAAMTAKLVQDKPVAAYTGLSDLTECKIKDIDICIVEGDIVKELWDLMFSTRPCLMNQKNKTEWSGPTLIPSYDDLFEKVNSSECKFALSESGLILSKQHERYCGDIVTVGEPFGTRASAMIAPHNWVYYDELRHAILKVLESYTVVPSVEEYFAKHGNCEILPEPQLSFRQLRLFFILAFVAVFVMFFVILLD